jgi:hypothetical protein
MHLMCARDIEFQLLLLVLYEIHKCECIGSAGVGKYVLKEFSIIILKT